MGWVPLAGLSPWWAGALSSPAAALAAGKCACHFAVMAEPTKSDPHPDEATPGEDSGLRPGEIVAELPARFDASLYYIGRIRTPWQRRDLTSACFSSCERL